MKRIALSLVVFVNLFAVVVTAQSPKTWNQSQLLPPATLAERINKGLTSNYVLISVGPDAMIPGSVDIGPGQESGNIQKLKTQLAKVDRSKEVIVYCGCCPFDKCLNIRPAFNALVAMGFKNARVLDIPRNMKVNWIDMNYPVKG